MDLLVFTLFATKILVIWFNLGVQTRLLHYKSNFQNDILCKFIQMICCEWI